MIRCVRGATGLRYCYQTSQEFRCPCACSDGALPSDPVFAQAAVTLATRGLELAQALKKAHRNGSVESSPRPGRCEVCDVKLEALGYAAWIERPARPPADPEFWLEFQDVIGRTLYEEVPGSRRMFGLRREAKEWVIEQALLDRALAAEEEREKRDSASNEENA